MSGVSRVKPGGRLKVLIVFHGMPPIAGRTVVGSGLRAFANGEALRAAGHEILYCTRHEDLPETLRQKARRSAPGGSLLLTSVTGPVSPPGDRSRRRAPPTAALDAVLGPAPAAIGMAPDTGDPSMPPDWSPAPGSGWTPVEGLAHVGGPLGAPGNPLAFTEPYELQAAIAKVNPDAVLVESIEDARYIQEGRWTVILDLFAPRLLEQQFQTGAADTREAVRILDALQRADRFLFSNERQKYFHLPLLALAGVDCTQDAGGVVPISCPPDTPPFIKPPDLTFIAGGVFWPWADLSGGLRDLLDSLDTVGTGRVRLYGGEYGIRSDTQEYSDPRDGLPRDHERVEFAGMVPIDTLWDEYRRGSVAFDLMAPNPEREINLSFRQIDYLRAGLPIITAPTQVIARDLEEYGAGWLVEPGDRKSLERLVRKLSTNPKLIAEAATAAQALARDKYAWTKSGAALIEAVEKPLRRSHGETLFATLARTQADLWEEHEDAKRLRVSTERQHEELGKKSLEVEAQDSKIRQLLSTVDRLTLSLEEVSRFRTETVGYLAQEQDLSLREAAELQRELDRRDLDVKKRDSALSKATAEIDKLKAAVAELGAQNLDLQAQFADRDGEVLSLNETLRAATDRLRVERSALASAKREIETRSAALAELTEQLQVQETGALRQIQRAEAAARKVLLSSEARVAESDSAHALARVEGARLIARVAALQVDLRKKTDELAAEKTRAQRDLEDAALRADAARAQLLEDHAVALRSKDAELIRSKAEAARHLGQVKAEAADQLVQVKTEAADQLEQVKGDAARDLTGQLTQVKAEAAGRLTQAKAEAARQLGQVKAEAARLLGQVKAEAADQLVQVKTEAADQLEQVKADAARDLTGQLTQVKAEAAGQLTQAKAEAARQLGQVKAEAARLLGQVKAEAADQLGQAKVEAADQLEQVKGDAARDLTGQLTHVKAEAAGQLTHVKAEAARQLTHVKAEAARQLDQVKAEAAQELSLVRDGHARAMSEAAADASRARVSLQAFHAREIANRDEALRAAQEAADALLVRELEVRDAALSEGERLRVQLESRFLGLLHRAESDAQRALNAAVVRTEEVAAERGSLAAQIEELDFERQSLRSEAAKKKRELESVGGKLAAMQAERDGLQLRVGELTVQVEQKDYAVRSLSADADKKSRELQAVVEQREGLQAALDSASATLADLESQRDAAHEDLQAALRKLDEAALDEEPDSTPPKPPTAQA